eukprot:gene33447-41271_t
MIETGTFQLVAEPVDLSALLHKVAHATGAACAGTGVSIAVDAPASAGHAQADGTLDGDSRLLMRAVANLLGNAA